MVFGSDDYMSVDGCYECDYKDACGAVTEPEPEPEQQTSGRRAPRTRRTR